MLLVDDRAGSKELLKPLVAMGLPAILTSLPSADLAFEGRGESGRPVLIGIEYKKLGELVGSLRTQRLQGHQLEKMRDTYEFSYLLVEGEVLFDAKGRLQRRAGRRDFAPLPGGMGVSELYKRLHVLHLRGGLNVLWGHRVADGLQQIAALYRVWTDCNLDEHKSHIAVYSAPALVPLSGFRQSVVGMKLPHIGIKTSKAVEAYFGGSLRRALLAPEAEWAKIEGIGPKTARQIQERLA